MCERDTGGRGIEALRGSDGGKEEGGRLGDVGRD